MLREGFFLALSAAMGWLVRLELDFPVIPVGLASTRRCQFGIYTYGLLHRMHWRHGLWVKHVDQAQDFKWHDKRRGGHPPYGRGRPRPLMV